MTPGFGPRLTYRRSCWHSQSKNLQRQEEMGSLGWGRRIRNDDSIIVDFLRLKYRKVTHVAGN